MGRRRRTFDPTRSLPPKPQGPSSTGQHDRVAIVFFFALFLGTGSAVVYLFGDFAADALLALLLTGLFAPIHDRLRAKTQKRPWVAPMVTSLLLILFAVGPVAFLVTSLTTEAASLYGNVKDVMSKEAVERFFFGGGAVASAARRAAELVGFEYTAESIQGTLSQAASAVATFLYKQANTLVSNVARVVFHFIVIVVLFFYLQLDGEKLKGWILQLSPLPDEEDAMIVSRFNVVGRAIFLGNGVGSVVQGLIGGTAMAAAGLPSPVLWGSVMTIFAFLPMVGISAVTLPAAIYLWLIDRPLTAIIFFSFCTAQAFFLENVVKTRLIGAQVKLHDLVIFLSVLAGLGTFGVLGILFGPLLVTLFLVLCDLYEQRYKLDLAGRRAESGSPP